MKGMKQKPEIIAFSKGLTVIPFENIIAVMEDDRVDGQLVVAFSTPGKIGPCEITLPREHTVEFIEKYNLYLAAVEGLTMTMNILPDDGSEIRP